MEVIEEHQSAVKRELPWFIDIFLYPVSIPAAANMCVFLGLLYLLELIPFGLIGFLMSFVITAYISYYLAECVRDSALGGLRAPQAGASGPDMGEVFLQLWRIACCLIVFFGPICFYFFFTRKTDTIFRLLLAYAVFFFPMGLLAVIMFGSISALNPLLLIRSIFSMFFQYCGLVLVFCGGGVLVAIIVSILPRSRILPFILLAVFIYLAMVVAHLLGRLYYRNSGKLNWEV